MLLQLDEPSLPAVLAGRVPTESGLSAYRAVAGPDAPTALRTVVEAVGVPVVVHCCAPDVPLQVVRDAGAAAVALDLSLLKDLDPLGEAIEAGLGLFAGAAPADPPATAAPPTAKQIAERVRTAVAPAGLRGGTAAAAGGRHAGLRAGRAPPSSTPERC